MKADFLPSVLSNVASGRAYATVFRPSVCNVSLQNVLWVNGAS